MAQSAGGLAVHRALYEEGGAEVSPVRQEGRGQGGEGDLRVALSHAPGHLLSLNDVHYTNDRQDPPSFTICPVVWTPTLRDQTPGRGDIRGALQSLLEWSPETAIVPGGAPRGR